MGSLTYPPCSKGFSPSRRQKVSRGFEGADVVFWELLSVVCEQQAREHISTDIVLARNVPNAKVYVGVDESSSDPSYRTGMKGGGSSERVEDLDGVEAIRM